MTRVSRIRIAFAIAIIIATVFLPIRQARATTNVGDQFLPFGPSVNGVGTKALLIKIYSTDIGEFQALQAGQIDFTDWPLTPDFIKTLCGSVGFACTPTIGGLNFFDIEFNHASTLWGCAFQFGNSPCGSQIRAANAHLVDKRAFILGNPNLQGLGSALDDTPDAVGLKSANNVNWDILHKSSFQIASTIGGTTGLSLTVRYGFLNPPVGPGATPVVGATVTLTGPAMLTATSNSAGQVSFSGIPAGTYTLSVSKNVPAVVRTFSGSATVAIPANAVVNAIDNIAIDVGEISAFNVVADPASVGGTPAVGTPDWLAARDHLIAAGITVGTNGELVASGFRDDNNDGIIDNPPASQIRFFIRNDDPIRLDLGSNLAAALNRIFGATVVSQIFVDIKGAFPVVFSTKTVLDWDEYTGGFQLTTPFWDYLYSSFDSLFASNQCGGPFIDLAPNYWFYCRADADPLLFNVEFSPTTSQSASFGLQALDIIGPTLGDIPIYSRAIVMAWLSNWIGSIVQQGTGPPNPWTFMNAYSSNPAIPQTVRWGFKQGTSTLNLAAAVTAFEFNVLNEVYDSLLKQNPYSLAQLTSWMANSWKLFLNPTAVDLGYNPPGSTQTTIRFDLRKDLRWHDGVPVTSDDVKFSFTNYLGLGFPCCVSVLQNLVNVTSLGPYLVDFHFNAKSFAFEINVGTLPIMPQHIFDTNGDGIVDTDKSTVRFDPVATLIYPAGTVLSVKDPSDSANWNNAALVRHMQITLPVAVYGLVGSGPFVCDQRNTAGAIIAIGGLCSSTGTDSESLGGSFLLHAYDSAFAALKSQTDPFYQYFRSTERFKQWNWADADNSLRVDTVDVSQIASAFDCRVSRTLTSSGVTFTYTRTCEKPNVAVTFTASTDGTWDFGDTATAPASANTAVTHPYSAIGFYTVKFTPTGGSPIIITPTSTSRVRILPFTVTSAITGAVSETDWTYWDRFGPQGQVDLTDIAFALSWFRVAWLSFAGGAPPGLPTGVWDQVTNAATGQGIASFSSVSGLLP